MTRKKQIEAAAIDPKNHKSGPMIMYGPDAFIDGAKWADSTNPWKQLCEDMAKDIYDYIGKYHDDYCSFELGIAEEVCDCCSELLKKYEALKNDPT